MSAQETIEFTIAEGPTLQPEQASVVYGGKVVFLNTANADVEVHINGFDSDHNVNKKITPVGNGQKVVVPVAEFAKRGETVAVTYQFSVMEQGGEGDGDLGGGKVSGDIDVTP
ncbi:hypothetical protein CWI84_03805 [Idiomarina tyrosinivorans]|uniref:Uncharacterized protein n=1 Tax=Idiomarina tyrosinivorans TaxID=1445662 RepID=A0A432ZS48_9GAMM|nr:hypothetical protein [Idiomarina tyrosinivorans]RUO80719.1 hypothetical protein CWI84_03805 [Idiomarina tyrosinivorans]